ncbi:transposase family protein [Saccharopolyspora shandongensis]|uniref:transposase family protein n=1 Tax=Saccharopolyspora shandongensis TaxID=418495 RepID=UPI00340A07DF
MDLWWSGEHRHHGANIQVVSAPDGWPLWTSDARPGREHDMSGARADLELLARHH